MSKTKFGNRLVLRWPGIHLSLPRELISLFPPDSGKSRSAECVIGELTTANLQYVPGCGCGICKGGMLKDVFKHSVL